MPAKPKKPAAPPPSCPYCGQDARLMLDSSPIYHGRNYGPVWICDDCQAWVGTHKGRDNAPLGPLANAELRALKSQAHAAFDPLWKRKMARDGLTKGHARAKAYAWLAGEMNIEPRECHIGHFSVGQCEQVIAICKPFLGKCAK